MAPPRFAQDPRFLEGIEDLSVEEFVAQPRVEAFDVTALPGRARLDEGCLGADCGDPPLHSLGDELRTLSEQIVRRQMI